MKYKFSPFSQNIIFLDTEFTSLDPYQGEILSIGLVKITGEELYLELKFAGRVDTWVRKNILPTLKDPKISREAAILKINNFIGSQKPYIVAYINQYDVIYTYKLFGKKAKPFYWVPIDFASILFTLGINPEAYYYKDKDNFFKDIGINTTKYNNHNALDDARLLREVYLKMTTKI